MNPGKSGRRLLLVAALCAGASAQADEAANVVAGRDLAHEVAKGNCLACHSIPGDPKAVTRANIGPPLIALRLRFPEREKLREQLWNPMQFNPNTVMPPFGKHKILTEEEIDLIVDYLYTL